MAFRFNGGMGAVTCDHCNVIIDEDLSYAEYVETYGAEQGRQKKDYCPKHFKPENRKKVVKEVPDGVGLGSASCEAGRIETTPQRRQA